MSFRINRVYTRTGDDGTTALVGGTRVSKANPRVAAFGDLDELNALLGVVKERLPVSARELLPLIEQVQQELFDLGAGVATPDSAGEVPQIAGSCIEQLETWCDHYNNTLPELTSFVLPGGDEGTALLHLARTVCRRAERQLASLCDRAGGSDERSLPLIYLNRLSDLLFILARWTLAQEGKEAPLWIPASERR